MNTRNKDYQWAIYDPVVGLMERYYYGLNTYFEPNAGYSKCTLYKSRAEARYYLKIVKARYPKAKIVKVKLEMIPCAD